MRGVEFRGAIFTIMMSGGQTHHSNMCREAAPSAQQQSKSVDRRKRGLTTDSSISRVINVTGAGYADCSGLYAISNMTSIWDSKRIVFERVAGGWRPMDKR